MFRIKTRDGPVDVDMLLLRKYSRVLENLFLDLDIDNPIDIPLDVDKDTLLKFINFCEHGTNIDEKFLLMNRDQFHSLLRFSDVYDVPELRSVMLRHFSKQITLMDVDQIRAYIGKPPLEENKKIDIFDSCFSKKTNSN